MGERKSINKYFPPNFDPKTFEPQKGKGKKTVRLMAPFTMRCVTCGEFTYKGKKFNAKKETVPEEEYLGIEVFRFYIKCPSCAAEMTFKTDPRNTDYVAEYGCTRNFEPWREERIRKAERLKKRLEDETNNPMKALENKTFDSKREIEIIEGLDEIRSLNARKFAFNMENVEKYVHEKAFGETEELNSEYQQIIKEAFASKKRHAESTGQIPKKDEFGWESVPKKAASGSAISIQKKGQPGGCAPAVSLIANSYDSD
jgi:hypothetical protein